MIVTRCRFSFKSLISVAISTSHKSNRGLLPENMRLLLVIAASVFLSLRHVFAFTSPLSSHVIGSIPLQRGVSSTFPINAEKPTVAQALHSINDVSGTSKFEYLASLNETISFPSYNELMGLGVGGFATSKPFTLSAMLPDGTTKDYDFCIKLYPRGGGHKSQHSMMDMKEDEDTGFGMSYAVPSPFGNGPKDEKVGVYLQFLPRSPNDTVDVSFALRIKGRQRVGRKFDVEWRAGMRFVSLENSKLSEGMANDFGAHLMQTQVLGFVLGIMEENDNLTAQENDEINADLRDKPLELEVEINLHSETEKEATLLANPNVSKQQKEGVVSGGFGLLKFDDLRETSLIGDSSDKEPLRVGKIVVPVLRKLSQRPNLFAIGAYPGVEYRILRIIDPETDKDLFYSRPSADYEIKPIYPLVQQLERPWPVRVNEKDIPKLISSTQYNLISAVGSLLAAGSALFSAFIISQAVSLFFIPSKSMEPTLQIGDVLLVDKVTPRILPKFKKGDVVLFHPPEQLQDLVSRNSGGARTISDRDLFVKRIAAMPGDTISVVDKAGTVKINGMEPLEQRNLCATEPLKLIEQYMEPDKEIRIQKGEVAVFGDCSSVSVDSR